MERYDFLVVPTNPVPPFPNFMNTSIRAVGARDVRRITGFLRWMIFSSFYNRSQEFLVNPE